MADAPPRPFTYGETQASVIGVVERIFAPQLVGMDVFAREPVHALLHRTVGNPAAKSAVDTALWDIAGQALGLSVTRLLGGWSDRMRVAHMLGFDDPERMAAEAERMRDSRGLREVLGEGAELYVDGNRGWTTSETAAALRELDGLGITLAEELCPADDVLGRRWLVPQSPRAVRRGRVGHHARRGDPLPARRRRHRDQHQDGPHRFHRLPGRALPV
ncbi:enolase C-terminal domain-like protein [Streptomyces sp. NPDC050619]|uniref:mandelate racemase/muconate lactonizing enzyme family protein n=1 Tax=Streptomyces sp. NPDC050619 TaxID=3157214 RepID=UPI00343BA9CE